MYVNHLDGLRLGFLTFCCNHLVGSVIPPIAFLREEFRLRAASPASQQTVKPRNTKSKKRNKHSKKTKKNQQSTSTRPAGPGRSISQEELSDHLVNSYIKSGHTDDNTVAQSTQEYLKQLNSRPSLVLNADYQVSDPANFSPYYVKHSCLWLIILCTTDRHIADELLAIKFVVVARCCQGHFQW